MVGQGIDIFSLQPLRHILHLLARYTVDNTTVFQVVVFDKVVHLLFRIVPFQNGVVYIWTVKPANKCPPILQL